MLMRVEFLSTFNRNPDHIQSVRNAITPAIKPVKTINSIAQIQLENITSIFSWLKI